MGGKGPGSCMSGGKGKDAPKLQSKEEQERSQAETTHVSAWKKTGSINNKLGHIDAFMCTRCGMMTTVTHGETPSEDIHENRKK